MHTENIKYIQNLMLNQSNTGFGKIMSGHYILFWWDNESKTFVAYEGKDPVKCYQAVSAKHASYEFAGMQAMPNSNSAVDLIRCLRTANLMVPELTKTLELLRIERSSKSA